MIGENMITATRILSIKIRILPAFFFAFAEFMASPP